MKYFRSERGLAPFLIVVIIIGALVIGGKVWDKSHQEDAAVIAGRNK